MQEATVTNWYSMLLVHVTNAVLFAASTLRARPMRYANPSLPSPPLAREARLGRGRHEEVDERVLVELEHLHSNLKRELGRITIDDAEELGDAAGTQAGVGGAAVDGVGLAGASLAAERGGWQWGC